MAGWGQDAWGQQQADQPQPYESASPLPFGPPALSQGAWRQAAVSSDTAVPETSQIAVRNRNRAEMESRALAPEDRPPAQPVDYDQNDEEGTRGHMIDAARDDARQDRSFARSTAKLTPAQFAELADSYQNPVGHATSSAAAQFSTVVVEEAEPENLLAPAGWSGHCNDDAHDAFLDFLLSLVLARQDVAGSSASRSLAIVATRLAEIPFVLSMDAGTPEQFAAVSLDWTASSAKTEHDLLAPRTQMLEQYWVFVKAAESLFVESLGYQMGFARCSKVPRERSAKSIAHFQREMAIRALAAPVLAPSAKSRLPASSSSPSATPLLDLENAEKQKWAKRLKAIADRAGEHARPEGVHDAEGFEKFELWARHVPLPLYPISDDKILKYAMELDSRECGPTVLPSLRMALKWVAFRINLKLPSIETAELKALEKEIFTQRGRPLKEAIAFPLELVQAMERFVANEAHPVPARVFLWWVLCMIFASLRFDDAIHVKPHELEVKPNGLFGISWHTKTERKRRGTKFMVPDVAFSKVAWFKIGKDLFESQFPLVERDFWIPELDTKERWRQTPPDYARSLQWLHHLVWLAGQESGVAREFLDKVTDLTWSSLPAKMIKELVQEVSREFVVPVKDSVEEIACKRRPPPWVRWAEVPRDPDTIRELGPWCLEIFAVFDWLLLLCRMGAIVFLHLGIPCALPLGLYVLKKHHQAQLFEANELLFRSLLLFDAVVQAGGDASIENPKDSLIWQVPQVQQLKVRLHLYNVDLDQCEYGLPPALCTAWAIAVAAIVQKSAQQFAASFALTAPSAERKRSLGSQIAWKGHRQSAAARLAAASGYQLKRGAAMPLLDVECEPGQAIQWSLQVRRPFTVQPALPDKIVDNIKFIVSSPQALVARRSERLQFWQQRALTLLPETDRILRSISDAPLRRLLRGAPDYADLQLGSCTHVALYDELFAAIGCTDHQILQGIRGGFPIVGEIQRSGRWPPFTKPQRSVPVQEALDRAMSYSRGVLMYNFNEDRFGEDLQHKPKVEDAPKMSVSHTVHNWKTPSVGKAENPSPGLDRHVLFGHTGDMRDPHTNLQKVDFMTTNQTGGYLVIRFASIYVKVMQPAVYFRMMQERHHASQSTSRLFCFLTSQRVFILRSFGLFGAALYKGCLMKCFRSQCR
ncbi:unnamed protein product [Symbiodinium sp. CCMP2592]|nr:unnamed protein product [Symbiodinium sp. CCMP2592]